jgi:hypothetical protein
MSPSSRQAAANVAERLHSLGLTHAASMQGAQGVVAGTILKMVSVSAFEDAFLVGGFIVFLAILPALLLPAKKIKLEKSDHVAVME